MADARSLRPPTGGSGSRRGCRGESRPDPASEQGVRRARGEHARGAGGKPRVRSLPSIGSGARSGSLPASDRRQSQLLRRELQPPGRRRQGPPGERIREHGGCRRQPAHPHSSSRAPRIAGRGYAVGMPLPPVLHRLLAAAGPSGYETAPADVFAEAARAFTDEVSVDVMGSVVARVPGTVAGAPLLAIVGHIDEIGLMVTHIDDDGFLRFAGVGGWDPQILVGQRVRLMTKGATLPGVLGRKAIHLLREEDRKKVPELRELHIDIGAKDGDEARAQVRIGDVAVIDGEPIELLGDRVISRAMDNRLGAFIALEAARLVAE